MVLDLIAAVPDFAAVPSPTPQAPPGSGAFMKLINWLMWGAIVFGLFGLIVSVILVFTGVMDGRSSQGFRAFLIVCAGLIVLGMLGQIVNALT